MSKTTEVAALSADEVRKTYGIHVSFSLFGVPDALFDVETQRRLEEAATDLTEIYESQCVGDVPDIRDWVLARLSLAPGSGIDPDDAEGLHEAAIMSTTDVLRSEGHRHLTRDETRRLVSSLREQ